MTIFLENNEKIFANAKFFSAKIMHPIKNL